jgi:2-methylcitrate dehydratase PrpD
MVTQTLVRNCLNTRYEDIPEDVLLHAKKSILNWLGVAIGASHDSSVDMAIAVTEQLSAGKQVSILGRQEKTDMLFAALINGMSSHVFDFDDTHLDTIHHPSSPVAPVCFALAEQYHLSGKQVLRAFALGVEAELRISNAVCPAHYDLGWHITSTAGVFGAAVAAGILLELDEEQMLYALGLAGTQAFGLREMFGTMTKPFHPGKAAQNGLLSVLLAQKGFTSSKQVLEAKRGFANVLSPKHDLEQVNINWGTQWELLKNAFKAYACGIVLHPSIDACIALGKMVDDPSEVQAIEITVNPYVLELTGKPTPKTGLEGKFSIYHTGAAAFLDGDAGVEQYTDEMVLNPRTIEFRGIIKPVVDEALTEDEAVARMTTKDGQVYEYRVDHASGSIENPMTDEDITRKFKKLTKDLLSDNQINSIIEKMYALDDVTNMNEVIIHCNPSST